MAQLTILGKAAFLLTIIGGLNWGLVGLFDWDLVKFIFQVLPGGARIVYSLVGLSALYVIYDTWIAPSTV